jgi:hypothetical protein
MNIKKYWSFITGILLAGNLYYAFQLYPVNIIVSVLLVGCLYLQLKD